MGLTSPGTNLWALPLRDPDYGPLLSGILTVGLTSPGVGQFSLTFLGFRIWALSSEPLAKIQSHHSDCAY